VTSEPRLLHRVLRNSIALTVGRVLVGFSRLAIAALIVRQAGVTTFGEYALLLGVLAVAEWVNDFGTNEIAVREICQPGADAAYWLRLVALGKLLQAPLAVACLMAVLMLLQYPPHIVQAGAWAACSLLFMAAVGVYRVLFKSTLTMELEMLAEVGSVLLTVPLIVLALHLHGGLSMLMACHVASRALFLLLCHLLAWRRCRFNWRGPWRQPLRQLYRAAAPIGLIGLMVALYEAMDLLFLSKMGQALDLAWYSAAQRIVWPLLLLMAAIGSTMYPVLARCWPSAPERFAQSCQVALEAVLFIAGGAAAVCFAGAEFWLGLLSPDLVGGAPVMRVLALLVFIKAFAATLGPALYIVDAQRQVLGFISRALLVKALAVGLLVVPFGALGVAAGAVTVELLFAAVPTIRLLQRKSSWRGQWSVPIRIIVVMTASAGLAHAMGDAGGPASTLLAVALYPVLSLLTGVISRPRINALLAARQP
jgi:O-antigen/teichoic acid export membrane protein